jgi:hypothetical protein
MTVIFHTVQAINLKITKGRFWTVEDSIYFTNGVIDTRVLWLVLLRSIIALGLTCSTFYMVLTSIQAQINNSVVSSITCSASFFSAIAFYSIFGEILNKAHLAGMLLMIGSIVLTQWPVDSAAEAMQLDTISIWVPIMWTLSIAMNLTVGAVVLRFYSRLGKSVF